AINQFLNGAVLSMPAFGGLGRVDAIGGGSVKYILCLACLGACVAAARGAEGPNKIEFSTGDRVALIGNDFFDREQNDGYIETALTSRFFDKGIKFRNLGYSGDTVWAQARNLCSGWDQFGPPDQGFKRLEKLVDEFNPTIVFVAYGMNESFDGPNGLEHFTKGLERMVDMLTDQGEYFGRDKKARSGKVVLVSPICHEDLGAPLPDPSEHNRQLRTYIAAMQAVAKKRDLGFINLFEATSEVTGGDSKLTTDGIHLTPYGYWRVATAMERAMGYAPRTWRVEVDAKETAITAEGTQVSDVKREKTGLAFTARDGMLPFPPPIKSAPASVLNGTQVFPGQERVLKVTGLQPGQYELKSEGRTICIAAAEEWARGVQLLTTPADQQAEALRARVVAKEFDYFNYWRSENDTYIFGYRKHEQGRNAGEVPNFLNLLKEKEAQVEAVAVPDMHGYELTLKAGK
ncbi:MAG TPA: SGNH/GDSL hydrolase family protein, partial [Tepidisphaeraceae bacterium]